MDFKLPVSGPKTLLALATLAVLVSVACVGGSSGDSEATPVISRLDPPATAVPLELSALFKQERSRSWRLVGRRPAKDLTLLDGSRSKDGLLLPQAGATLEIQLDEGFELDALDLNVRGVRGGTVIVHWAPADGGYGAQRQTRSIFTGSPRVVHVPLVTHPAWTGDARRLRVSVRPTPAGGFWTAMHAASYRAVGRLAGALERTWSVNIKNDVRPAQLSPPGWTFERPIPAGGRHLRFSYGVEGSPRQQVRFEIRDPTNGETLFNQVVSPTTATGWAEAEIDLPAKVDSVEFTTEADGPWDLKRAVPAWAGLEVLAGKREESRLNVLMISVDTLRADRLSLYGYSRPTSKSLEAWAERGGVVFEHTVAAASWTLPSHVSMLSGLSAMRHGINRGVVVPDTSDLITERFRDAGYQTVGLTAGAYLSPAFGLNQGFDSFRARTNPTNKASCQDELVQGLEELKQWLTLKPRRPFFAFFHTYEPHAPFCPRQPYFEQFGGDAELLPKGYATTRKREPSLERNGLFSIPGSDLEGETEIELVSTLYDSEVAYTDEKLGELFDFLDTSGLLDETIVVLTSDHGESFGGHGLAGHGHPYEDNLSIPLVIWWPGTSSRVDRVEELVASVDIAPTLLDLAGLEPLPLSDGVSLRPLLENRPLAPRSAIEAHSGYEGISLRFRDGLKYIFKPALLEGSLHHDELYDLELDPEELNDVETTHPESARRRQLLLRALRDVAPGVRASLRNDTDGLFSVGFSSPRNHLSAVVPLGCDKSAWKRGGLVVIQLGAGESCELLLSHLTTGPLRVIGWPGASDKPGKGAPAVSFDTAKMQAAENRWIADAGWKTTPPESPAVFVQLVWTGERRSKKSVEVKPDEALRDQLKALGYLD